MSTLRRYVVPLAVIGALIVLYIEFPYSVFGLDSLAPSQNLSNALAIIFWVLAILVVVALFQDRKSPEAQTVEIEGPAFTRYLFNNTRAGLIWLPIRFFLATEWLSAGIHKIQGGGWLDGGTALQGFWKTIVVIPANGGDAAISFDWYRSFIQFLLDNNAYTWFAWLITFGEIAVGLGLLLGILTGFAAFFGSMMNMSFLLAGSASVNPVMFTLAVGLILAWRVAGWYGVDRYLLPALGVPWSRTPAAAEPVTSRTPATS